MKKVVFGIFAHPDDESFGPSGTLTMLARHGYDLHLICVTDGGNGDTSGRTQELRHGELLLAGELMGATSTTMLGFSDGSLCNQNYPDIASAIKQTIANRLSLEADTSLGISFITFEQHGLTGHLDHIAVSMIVTHLFTSLDKWLPECTAGWLKYFCFCDAQKAEDRTYFVYSPQGYKEENVDETVSVKELMDVKKQVIQAHASQEDAKKILALGDHLLSQEHFIHYK